MRRHVAVHEPREGALDRGERAQQRAGDVHRHARPASRSSGSQTRRTAREVEPVDELEHEEGPGLRILAEREKRDDVGVTDARQEPRLLAQRARVLRLDQAREALDAHAALEAVAHGARDVDVARCPPARAARKSS